MRQLRGGVGSFSGAGGVAVWECERPRRRDRRRGKSDLIDAAVAGRRLLAGEGLCLPRGGGRREDLRLLLLERRSAIRARTATLNQLSALVVTAPAHVRRRLGTLDSHARLRGNAHRLMSQPPSCVASAVESTISPGRWPSSSAPSPPWSAKSPPICSASQASDPSALRSCSSRAAIRNGWQAKRPSLPRRHQPGRGLKRKTAARPAQPRWRSPTQLGVTRDRARTDPPSRRNRRLLRATTRNRQDRTRSTPLRQARSRTPLLPTPPRTPRTRLDNIEASLRNRCRGLPAVADPAI